MVVQHIWQVIRFENPQRLEPVLDRERPLGFLARLAKEKPLVLEVKGRDTQQDRTRRESLAEWVSAVNRGFSHSL